MLEAATIGKGTQPPEKHKAKLPPGANKHKAAVVLPEEHSKKTNPVLKVVRIFKTVAHPSREASRELLNDRQGGRAPSNLDMYVHHVVRPMNMVMACVLLLLYVELTRRQFQSLLRMDDPWRIKQEAHMMRSKEFIIMTSNGFCGRLVREQMIKGWSAHQAGGLMYYCLFLTEPHAISPHGYITFYSYIKNKKKGEKFFMGWSRTLEGIYREGELESLKKSRETKLYILNSIYNVRLNNFFALRQAALENTGAFSNTAEYLEILCNATTSCMGTSPVRNELAAAIMRNRWQFVAMKYGNAFLNDDWTPRFPGSAMNRNVFKEFIRSSSSNDAGIAMVDTLKLLKRVEDETVGSFTNEKVDLMNATDFIKYYKSFTKKQRFTKFLKEKKIGGVSGYWLWEEKLKSAMEDIPEAVDPNTLDKYFRKMGQACSEANEKQESRPLITFSAFLIMDKNGSVFMGGGGLNKEFGVSVIDSAGVAYDHHLDSLSSTYLNFQPILRVNPKTKKLKSVTLISAASRHVATQLRTNKLLLHHGYLNNKIDEFDIPLFPTIVTNTTHKTSKTKSSTHYLITPGYSMELDDNEEGARYFEQHWSKMNAQIMTVNVEKEEMIATHVLREPGEMSIFTEE